MTCYDTGVVGGFISTVEYGQTEFSTANPIADGNWALISDSKGILSPLVYVTKNDPTGGDHRWAANADFENIAADAVWIWNDQLYNTMVFEFDFGNIYRSAGAFGPDNFY